MQKIFKILLIILVVLIGGCKSRHITKKMQLTTPQTEIYSAEYVVNHLLKSQNNLSFINIIKAETNISFLGRNFYFISSVKIIKNQEIAISVAVLGMEVLRIQILPASIYIFDKFHRQYSQSSYDDLTKLLGVEISYHLFENLLTNRLFSVSNIDAANGLNKAFSIVQLPEKYILAEKQKMGIFTHFFDISPDFKILATSLNEDANEILSVSYSDFDIKNGVLFPIKIDLRANFKTKSLSANFDIKKIEINKKFEITPINIERYKKVELSAILPI